MGVRSRGGGKKTNEWCINCGLNIKTETGGRCSKKTTIVFYSLSVSMSLGCLQYEYASKCCCEYRQIESFYVMGHVYSGCK